MLFAIGVAGGRYTDPLSLACHHAQVYSQNGEDGMVAEIFGRIGTKTETFVEIGIETGQQNNTRLLLESGWRGVWVDGNVAALATAREVFADFVAAGKLMIVDAIVTVDNVDAVLEASGVTEQIDFLSLDIDQNTSHVWRALRRRTRVAVVEYNASLPASVALEVAYDPHQSWDGSNWYGASLKALELIGAAKGMSLVGCDLLGVNAFFVTHEEAVGRFREPFTAAAHWEPPRFHMVGHAGHPPAVSARRWHAMSSVGPE